MRDEPSGAGLIKLPPSERRRHGADVKDGRRGPVHAADGMLTLVPDQRPQAPDRSHVRLYDEWFPSSRVWKRAIALVDGTTNPPLAIPYDRVDEGAR